MTSSAKLAAIRSRHFGLEALPETLLVPGRGAAGENAEMSIDGARLDDLAFAIRAIEGDYNAIADKLFALRRLYSLARQAGALGVDDVLDAVATARGGSR